MNALSLFNLSGKNIKMNRYVLLYKNRLVHVNFNTKYDEKMFWHWSTWFKLVRKHFSRNSHLCHMFNFHLTWPVVWPRDQLLLYSWQIQTNIKSHMDMLDQALEARSVSKFWTVWKYPTQNFVVTMICKCYTDVKIFYL